MKSLQCSCFATKFTTEEIITQRKTNVRGKLSNEYEAGKENSEQDKDPVKKTVRMVKWMDSYSQEDMRATCYMVIQEVLDNMDTQEENESTGKNKAIV